MALAVLTLSHSPLMGFHDPEAVTLAKVETAFDNARSFVNDFDPDLVVLFAPDHYNGVFYDLMPPFCLGTAAKSVGDWNSSAGQLSVDRGEAQRLARAILDRDVDIAISERLEVDHGFAQPLDIIFGGIDTVPVVPIFINAAAPPLCPVRRIRALGHAVGEAFADDDRDILIMGSGGLSHDPPVPRLEGATAEIAERLIAGRDPSEQDVAARVANVIRTSDELTAGTATIMPLNPIWDEEFLDLIERGDLADVDDWSNDSFVERAGHASHEVRTWVAAYSALEALGRIEMTYRFYHPIPEWIAGFGVTTARLANHS